MTRHEQAVLQGKELNQGVQCMCGCFPLAEGSREVNAEVCHDLHLVQVTGQNALTPVEWGRCLVKKGLKSNMRASGKALIHGSSFLVSCKDFPWEGGCCIRKQELYGTPRLAPSGKSW